MSEPASTRIWIARGIALAADALQICLFPMFAPVIASPLNIALDCVAAFVLWRLIGWHIAFVPSFVTEQVPLLNMAPTWTIAVWIATRDISAPPPDNTRTFVENEAMKRSS